MKIEITDRQAVVLGIAIASYNKELEEYKKRGGEILPEELHRGI